MILNDNIGDNSWSEYGRLVLKELERLNEGREKNERELIRLSNLIAVLQKEIEQHRDIDEKTFKEQAGYIKNISDELNRHLKEVNEVWSPTQMQQVKNEVYRQKNQWQKIAGIVIAVQVIFGLLLIFLEKFVNI